MSLSLIHIFKNWFESEQMKMNYEYMAKWFTEGYIRKDAGSLEKIEVSFAKDGLDGFIPVSYTHLDVYKRQR